MLKDNLIMLRNIHGVSQEEVAGKIGISRQAYARWESGAAVPDIVKCGRLAAVYGVTMDSLVKDEKIEGFGSVPPPPAGKSIWGTVTVNGVPSPALHLSFPAMAPVERPSTRARARAGAGACFMSVSLHEQLSGIA